MSEMIERVAKALRKNATGSEAGWAYEESNAIAAIRAMREPTVVMLDAGVDRWDTHHPLATETHPNERATWQAMIDAALVPSPSLMEGER